MATIDYSRVTPRARSGTMGVSEEVDMAAGEYKWISVPDRIAAITTAVHIPEGVSAEFAIEGTCNRVENLDNGTGGYWDPLEEEVPTYTKDRIIMLCNAVTGIRVRCISAEWSDGKSHDGEPTINVCFCA